MHVFGDAENEARAWVSTCTAPDLMTKVQSYTHLIDEMTQFVGTSRENTAVQGFIEHCRKVRSIMLASLVDTLICPVCATGHARPHCDQQLHFQLGEG